MTGNQVVPVATPGLTGPTVADVMVTMPTTIRPSATVADVRAFFEDDHVHMALIATSGTLLGTLVRADLAAHGDDAMPALSRARLDGRTVAATEPAEQVMARLIDQRQRRLAVLDTTGTLVGLLCLKRKLTGFCSDVDVAARAAERVAEAVHRSDAAGLLPSHGERLVRRAGLSGQQMCGTPDDAAKHLRVGLQC